MHIKYFLILISLLLICIGWAAAVDNPQGNNPVCGPCSFYNLNFNGPLEYTPAPEPLNVGAQNPGMIYVVYSVIDDESRPWWTQAKGVWQAWGPYKFKAGKGYILEFGPQDIIGMTEGPLPYYVEGTAAWLQEENVDYITENAYAYCIVPERTFLSAAGSSSLPDVQIIREPIEILDYTMSKTLENGYPGTTSYSFSESDNKAWVWVKLGKIEDGPHTATWVWYKPDGDQYRVNNLNIEDPKVASSSGKWYSYRIWAHISIDGYDAARNPGTWQVRLLIDDKPSMIIPFEIKGENNTAHIADLTSGWDIFGDPLSNGNVSWTALDDGKLLISFELSGAQPNHKYIVGAHFFDPSDLSKFPEVEQFGGWRLPSYGIYTREGNSANTDGWDFGYLITDGNGDGKAQFVLAPSRGIYYVQFTVRIGPVCIEGDTSGCGAVYRTGEKFGKMFEMISI